MIGILMYTLYDQTTGKNTPKNVGMYTSGDHFQSTLTIPNLTAGHTYYWTHLLFDGYVLGRW